MFSLMLSLFAFAASSAHAADGCYDYQVCEEVCTDLQVSSVTLSRTAGTRWTTAPIQHCETVCTVEQYCPPEDPTDGGEGADYSEDEFAECYAMPLLVDQIRCVQAMLAE